MAVDLKEMGRKTWKAADSAFDSAHGKIAAGITAALIATAAFVGIKSHRDKQEQERNEYAQQQAEYSLQLKQQISEKRQLMSVMSAKAGQVNRPSGNFRQMVRSGGVMDGPNTTPPDPNLGGQIDIIPENTTSI
jgi:uncharacterized protein HemX